MHSDWFNGIQMLQGRWQHGEKVGYCYPSGLENTIYKWDIYVPLVTKGLREETVSEHSNKRSTESNTIKQIKYMKKIQEARRTSKRK